MKAVVKTDKLAELLFRKGWSGRRLAIQAKVGIVTAQQICNGQRNPSAPVAKKIVDALGCEWDEIFEIVSKDQSIPATSNYDLDVFKIVQNS